VPSEYELRNSPRNSLGNLRRLAKAPPLEGTVELGVSARTNASLAQPVEIVEKTTAHLAYQLKLPKSLTFNL
jgi:hypothetical protein